MDPARYSALVSRLEEAARLRPRALRRQMFLLIALGYGYVLLILGLVVGAAVVAAALMLSGKASALAFKLLLPLGAVAWLIVRSIWVKTSPPEGERLEPSAAPHLTQRVEEIRSSLRAPRADAILLTNEFNASVVQVPRLGIFGWPRTYLVLGISLMFALERAHFDAVLAHEFAHLSGAHPKRGLWVYRMSRTWQQLLDQLQEARSWVRKLFEPFIEWYVPRLEAYGFVLSRRDEYEADADAARVTSPAAMGGALVAVATREGALGALWEDVWSRVETESSPPTKSWSDLPARFQQAIPLTEGRFLLERALTRRADATDTHPSLAERLGALGLRGADDGERWQPDLALGETSAAEYYLGSIGHSLLQRMETEWRERASDSWREQHAQMKKDRARMVELLENDRNGSGLAVADLWSLATLVAQFDGEVESEQYYRRVLALDEDHAAAHFALGRHLLAGGDPNGIVHIERVMEQEPDAVPAGGEVLYQFYAARDDRDGVARIRQALYEHGRMARAATEEREQVRKSDTFVSADLSADEVAHLRVIAQADSRISKLWVVRKVTTLLPRRPHLVVVVERRLWRLGAWGRNDRQLAQDIVTLVDLPFADYLVIVVSSETAWLVKRARPIAGACVFTRRNARVTDGGTPDRAHPVAD